MTYSQINHAKAWGFSRRTPNLNFSPSGHVSQEQVIILQLKKRRLGVGYLKEKWQNKQ